MGLEEVGWLFTKSMETLAGVVAAATFFPYLAWVSCLGVVSSDLAFWW